MARPPSAASVLRNIKKQERRVPIGTDMYVPNHSGDHSAGRVKTTPTTDLEISNKKYVDDSISAIPAHLPLAGGVMTGDITIADSVSSIKSGAYSLQLQSNRLEAGSVPDTGNANIVVMWKADEGTGSTSADAIGNNTLTLTGTGWTGSGAFSYTGDDSFSFDGTNDKCVDTDDSSLKFTVSDAFTVQAWVKINTDQDGVANWIAGNADFVVAGGGYGLYTDTSNRLNFQLTVGAGPTNAYRVRTDSDVGLADNTWHLVTGSFSGSGGSGVIVIHIDGVQQTTEIINANNLGGKDLVTNAQPFQLGLRPLDNNLDMKGSIDTVCVYSDVRITSEILADWNASSGTAIGTIIDTSATYADTASKLLSLRNNTVEKFFIDIDGDITTPTVNTDLINEKTAANGVVIDGVTLKDADVDATTGTIVTLDGTTSTFTTVNGTTVNATGSLVTDTVSEETSANGVSVDSLKIKDGQIELLDDKNIIFGTGGDATIDFNQVDLIIDPAVVGSGRCKIGNTSYTAVSGSGEIFFSGTSAGLAYAEIYCYESGSTETITASGIANKVQITCFDTNGEKNNCTPDHTNDHITIDEAGRYLVTVSMSLESAGGSGYVLSAGVWKNNGATQFQNVHMSRSLSGGGSDIGSTSMSGICDFAKNDTIELWIWNETNTNDVVVDDVTLSVVSVGGT